MSGPDLRAMLSEPATTKRTKARVPQYAHSSPRAPPKQDSSRVSVSNWRMILERPAPSASRVDTSFSRAAVRASRRLARLAHAIRSTKITTPIKISRG